MKKIITVTLTLASLFAMTDVALATDPVSPLRSPAEITVATLTGNLNNPKVFPLANGSSLVTWQEVSSAGYFLKARTVSATNKLSSIQTINPLIAIPLDSRRGTRDTISINRYGQIFAVWVTQGLRYGVTSQKVWGRTSLDGITWTKPFVVIAGLTVSGDSRMCEMDPSHFVGCGYIRLKSAIDDKGRLAVLVADNLSPIGKRYRMKARSFLGIWSNFKTLTPTPEMRSSEIVGLTSGFAVSADKYNPSGNNSVKVSYYNPKSEAWTNTATAIVLTENTVIESHWVQRDTKNLSLAISASSNVGLFMRNFNVDSQSWSSDLITLQGFEENRFVTELKAAKVGADLVLLFNSYNQADGSNEIRVAKVSGLTPTISVAATNPTEINLLYVGSTLSNHVVLAFNDLSLGTKFGGVTPETIPTFLPNTAANSNLTFLTKTRSDLVLGVGLGSVDANTKLILIKGYVK